MDILRTAPTIENGRLIYACIPPANSPASDLPKIIRTITDHARKLNYDLWLWRVSVVFEDTWIAEIKPESKKLKYLDNIPVDPSWNSLTILHCSTPRVAIQYELADIHLPLCPAYQA